MKSYLRAILIGVLAGILVACTKAFWEIAFESGVLILLFFGIAIALLIVFEFILNPLKTSSLVFGGFSEIIEEIHRPSHVSSPLRWFSRGLKSLLLSFFGGRVGPEGPIFELLQSFTLSTRSASSLWSELQRRTDSACVLAAGLTSVCGFPLAGIVFPMELNVGGRQIVCVLSSLSAYLTSKWFDDSFDLKHYWPLPDDLTSLSTSALLTPSFLAACLLSFVLSILAAWFFLFLFRHFSISHARFSKKLQFKPFLGVILGVLLLLLASVANGWITHPAPKELALLFQEDFSIKQSLSLLIYRFLNLGVTLAFFQSTSLIWPLTVIGAAIGEICTAFVSVSPVYPAFISVSVLLSVMLGVPLTAALLLVGITGHFQVFVPVYVAGVCAKQLFKWLKIPNHWEYELKKEGLRIEDGRAVDILESLLVEQAMVNDFKQILETDLVKEIHETLSDSHYPFIVVVDHKEHFKGLLTHDQIESAYRESPSHVMQAKDLLISYRMSKALPVVSRKDTLSSVAHFFENTPVVPVLESDRKVSGLLFIFNLRITYDREIARRTIWKPKK